VLWLGGSPEFGDRDEPPSEVFFDYGFVEALLFYSANRALLFLAVSEYRHRNVVLVPSAQTPEIRASSNRRLMYIL
jgi:hypothetical protein